MLNVLDVPLYYYLSNIDNRIGPFRVGMIYDFTGWSNFYIFICLYFSFLRERLKCMIPVLNIIS